MSLKLTLAIALECFPTECRVQLLDTDTPTTVNYSPPVQARIKIWPGQLVALNTVPAIPEIVYRWHYVQVEGLKGDKVLITNHQGQPVELIVAPGLEVAPQVGDWVYATIGGSPDQSEVYDTAVDGRPAHPTFLRGYAFPKVEQFYQKITATS